MELPSTEQRIAENNRQLNQNEEQIRKLTRANHWLKQENKLFEKRLEEEREGAQSNSELLDEISKGLK